MLYTKYTGLKSSMRKAPNSTINVIRAALVVSFSNIGDSLLYVALPLVYHSLELSIVHVGILLSANRLIRFGSNTFAGYVYGREKTKRLLVISIYEGTMGDNLVFPKIRRLSLRHFRFR